MSTHVAGPASRSKAVLPLLLVGLVLVGLVSALGWLLVSGSDDAGRHSAVPSGSGANGPRENGSEADGSGDARADRPVPFTITGGVDGLVAPGVMLPLDLSLHNPHTSDLLVSGVTVVVESVRAPNAGAALPCGPGDFAVQQLAGGTQLTVRADSVTRLSDLGLPAAQWPHIGMHDLPVNQDGCKDAAVRLGYTAVGTVTAP